jgi:hypothetical protein
LRVSFLRNQKSQIKIAQIPIVRLLSFPQEYNNRDIATIAYLRYEFESQVLYADKDSADIGNLYMSVNVAPDGKAISFDDLRKHMGNYVFVHGTFRITKNQYDEIPSGVLVIHDIKEW